MPKKQTVDDYLTGLQHARLDEIGQLRALILAAHPDIAEQVKWNAPSFCIDGDDRVTMRLFPGDRVQIILHRGAKARDSAEFAFADDSGLVRWLAPGRGEVTLADAADLASKTPALRRLVGRWIDATRG